MSIYFPNKDANRILQCKLEKDIIDWVNKPQSLIERWKKPRKDKTKVLNVGKRTYYYEPVEESGKFGPTFLLHGKNGARYGLFKGVNNECTAVNLKTKRLIRNRFIANSDGTIAWNNKKKG